MTHLDDSQLPGARRDPAVRAHLAGCETCTARVAATERLATAAAEADRMLTGELTVPPLTVALPARPAAAGPTPAGHGAERAAGHGADKAAGHVPGRAAAGSRPAPRFGWRTSVRLAASLVAAQARLVPRILAPITALGFVAAVVLALTPADPRWAATGFGAVTSLLILLGGLAATGGPRAEYLLTVPVSPRAVFLARLALVLAVDLAAALAATLAAAGLARSVEIPALVSGWLGPSLLSAAVAVVLTVRGNHWLGAAAGAVVWFSAVTANLPDRRVPDVGMGAVLDAVWSGATGPVIVAGLLLAIAIRIIPGKL